MSAQRSVDRCHPARREPRTARLARERDVRVALVFAARTCSARFRAPGSWRARPAWRSSRSRQRQRRRHQRDAHVGRWLARPGRARARCREGRARGRAGACGAALGDDRAWRRVRAARRSSVTSFRCRWRSRRQGRRDGGGRVQLLAPTRRSRRRSSPSRSWRGRRGMCRWDRWRRARSCCRWPARASADSAAKRGRWRHAPRRSSSCCGTAENLIRRLHAGHGTTLRTPVHQSASRGSRIDTIDRAEHRDLGARELGHGAGRASGADGSRRAAVGARRGARRRRCADGARTPRICRACRSSAVRPTDVDGRRAARRVDGRLRRAVARPARDAASRRAASAARRADRQHGEGARAGNAAADVGGHRARRPAPAWPIVALSGPTFAREFAAALPSAVVGRLDDGVRRRAGAGGVPQSRRSGSMSPTTWWASRWAAR